MGSFRLVSFSALCFASAAPAQAPLTVSGLAEGAPLAITARATPDLLVVDLALEPDWHVYARDVGGGQPVSVRLPEGSDFAAAAALKLPPDTGGELSGEVRLQLPIARTGAGSTLRAVVDFTVCDPLHCLPPMSVTLAGDVPAADASSDAFTVLLVVDAVDERSARIEAFLGARGFEVTVSTYAQVTAADCEPRAVVLADSKLFGKAEKVRPQVLAFPRTKTPIVAVGFFGTELIEAHGIAMTSGYI